MKKTILNFCTALFIASALILISFSAYNAIKGNSLEMYPRFYKIVDGKKQFNPWSLISPVQVENQKVIMENSEFSKAIQYPVAPQFKCIAPNDTAAESYIASQIAKMIVDSVNSVKLRTTFDYDGSMAAVRNNAEPKTKAVETPTVYINLLGTASPEAVKYGFMNSIQPGVLEKENNKLAIDRVNRTDLLLSRNLDSHGITHKVITLDAKELQFSKTVDSLTAVEKLPSMRYVSADVVIPMSKLEITPITAPILLPIWLGLITLLISFLSGLRFKRSEKKEEVESTPFDWMLLFKILGTALLVSIMLIVFMMILPYIAKYLAIIIGLLIIAITLYAIIVMIRAVSLTSLWEGAITPVSALLEWILRVICWIILASVIYASNAYEWWKAQTTCRKLLLIHFLIDFIILITWLLGWWHIC